MPRVAALAAVTGLAALAVGILLFRGGDSRRDAPNAVVTDRGGNATASSRTTPTPATPAREPARATTKRTATPSPSEAAAPATSAETGSLRVVSDVAGAQVFLDRQFIGSTPATANGLKPGAYQLNVSAPGFDSHVETVEVVPGTREIAVTFRAVRLDAALDVIHKHRMGSCRGRLIATPTGLRYDTSDKDDVFTSALGDLETFQVDYLNKNLRVQPRRGKRYDFTDPDGNADRLFVFHRDVERARERLKQAGGQ